MTAGDPKTGSSGPYCSTGHKPLTQNNRQRPQVPSPIRRQDISITKHLYYPLDHRDTMLLLKKSCWHTECLWNLERDPEDCSLYMSLTCFLSSRPLRQHVLLSIHFTVGLTVLSMWLYWVSQPQDRLLLLWWPKFWTWESMSLPAFPPALPDSCKPGIWTLECFIRR